MGGAFFDPRFRSGVFMSGVTLLASSLGPFFLVDHFAVFGLLPVLSRPIFRRGCPIHLWGPLARGKLRSFFASARCSTPDFRYINPFAELFALSLSSLSAWISTYFFPRETGFFLIFCFLYLLAPWGPLRLCPILLTLVPFSLPFFVSRCVFFFVVPKTFDFCGRPLLPCPPMLHSTWFVEWVTFLGHYAISPSPFGPQTTTIFWFLTHDRVWGG